ncbi:MAG: phosphatase PAP2 family protein [Caldimonas sp.]
MNDALPPPARRRPIAFLQRSIVVVPAGRYVAGHLLLVPCLLALLAWQVQHSGLDMALTQLFVDPATHAFPWRSSVLLDVIGHHAARGLPFMVGGIALAAGVAGRRFAPLRAWSPILLAIAAAMLVGPLVVNFLKGMTTQHCPTALQSFGGVVAYADDRSASFWASSRQAAGHCLPSGHAAGGYALLSLYFAGWASGRPAWRWRGLAIGVAAGLIFSLVRLMQGAHFASATIWSATVDWTVCALIFFPLLCQRSAKAP